MTREAGAAGSQKVGSVRALILVDIQNDFCPGGALAVERGDAVVSVANRLMGRFDRVVATQDWHPAAHGSFAANHPGRKPGDFVELAGLTQILWPIHCVWESPGAALHGGLALTGIDRVVRKGMDVQVDSYSGFFDNGRLRATDLAEDLKQHGVTDAYVCGLATDYCVKFTALDAVSLGFRTHLIVDACRGVELAPGDIERALAELESRGVALVHSEALS